MNENSLKRMDRFADLAVRVGANVSEGQDVEIRAQIEHAPLARAIAEKAYEAGARFVNIDYNDPFQKLFRLKHALPESLPYIPEWWDEKMRLLAENKVASISIAGDPHPHLLAGVDADRLGKAIFPATPSRLKMILGGEVNWTIVAAPNEGWATQVLGEPDVDKLWELVAAATRLDEPDPAGAWASHIARLSTRAKQMNERRLDALHFSGPGTDLTVGLLPGSTWGAASEETSWGRRFVPNMPTEEIFTTPDYRRTSGVVACTKPLALNSMIVEGLRLRFEDGVCVSAEADKNVDAVLADMDRDAGAKRLGEVALVDASSAVGKTGVVFHNTLFDENAACHIAWGQGFEHSVSGLPEDADARDKAGFNNSATHTDTMIGGPSVDVDGLTQTGQRVPLLRDNVWQLS